MMTLAQALEGMERRDERNRPVPFDLMVVTADRKKNTGGELLELKGGVIRHWNGRDRDHGSAAAGTSEGGGMKLPNHWKNKTRNVELPNGEVRKVHIRLITRFNGVRVF